MVRAQKKKPAKSAPKPTGRKRRSPKTVFSPLLQQKLVSTNALFETWLEHHIKCYPVGVFGLKAEPGTDKHHEIRKAACKAFNNCLDDFEGVQMSQDARDVLTDLHKWKHLVSRAVAFPPRMPSGELHLLLTEIIASFERFDNLTKRG